MEIPEGTRLAMWFDDEQDTGAGLTEEIVPEMARLQEDGLHLALRHKDLETGDPEGTLVSGRGPTNMVVVPREFEERVIEAACESTDPTKSTDSFDGLMLEFVTIDEDGSITGIYNTETEEIDPILVTA